jgi:hypothetical protein
MSCKGIPNFITAYKYFQPRTVIQVIKHCVSLPTILTHVGQEHCSFLPVHSASFFVYRVGEVTSSSIKALIDTTSSGIEYGRNPHF